MTVYSNDRIVFRLKHESVRRIVHSGERFPYTICKTLFDESEGTILLDLSGYTERD